MVVTQNVHSYLVLTTLPSQRVSIAAGVFKCGYFHHSACRKNSDKINMRELCPGNGKTGIFS